MDKNFVYDRHGRRHKLVKRQDEVSSGSAKDAMMAGLHLQNAYQVLADAGKRLKGDPRPKLREWKKSGIGRQEFQEALEFVGAQKLPEEGIEALWQEMREGESFNEELQDEEGNNGSISVNALLFKILHRDKLKRRLKDSFIYNKGYNFVVNKFKPYDLRESDVVKSIVSVRHVSHAFLDLRLKDVEDWEIEAICYYVSSLLGKERKIGSSKIGECCGWWWRTDGRGREGRGKGKRAGVELHPTFWQQFTTKHLHQALRSLQSKSTYW